MLKYCGLLSIKTYVRKLNGTTNLLRSRFAMCVDDLVDMGVALATLK